MLWMGKDIEGEVCLLMEKENQVLNDAPPMRPWHQVEPAALATELRTDSGLGLSTDEAGRRQARDGFNELPEAPPPSLLTLFLSQFTSLIVWVLIGAALISGLLEDWLDAAAIIAIVFLNGLLGFIQEFRAERSLAALRKMSVATARVLRDGILHVIPARELVPGDLILLEAGDRVPADARLIYATNFQAQEASLTGESTPVEKGAQVIDRAEVPLADRSNMVFMGTVALSGKARGLVTATGLRTELGRIAAMIQKAAEAERLVVLTRRSRSLGTIPFMCLGRNFFWFLLVSWVMLLFVKALVGVLAAGLSGSGESGRVGHEGDGLCNDFVLAPFLTVFCFPATLLEPAFDDDSAAFLEILAAMLGLLAKHDDIDEADFLLQLVSLFETSAYCEAERGHRGAGRSESKLRMSGESAHHDDLVETGHCVLLR